MKSSRQIDTENKVNQAYEYAVSFYNKNNRGLENQLICLKEMMNLTGFDDKTCVQIQNPILALYSASDVIDLSHQTIRQHMNITSQNILSRLNEVTSMSELQSFPKTDYKELIKRTSNPQHGYLVPDKVIDMSGSSLKDGDIGVLVQHLQYQQLNLHKFDVSKNFIGDPSVGNLFYTFRLGSPTATYNIKYMNLSNNYISDEGANCMAYHIGAGSHPHLRLLDVSGNQITTTGRGYLVQALNNISQDLSIAYNTIKGFTKESLKSGIKFILYLNKENGVSSNEMFTTEQSLEHCKKAIENVGLNITFGVAKCKKAPLKYLMPKDLTIQDAALDILSQNKKLKPILSFICIAQESFFSVVDEDFSQCLTGLDSMLND